MPFLRVVQVVRVTDAQRGVEAELRRIGHQLEPLDIVLVNTAAGKAVGNPNFQLLIDTMHFFRWGATAADLAALDPAIIGHIQLCDVPMPAIVESYMEEALHERRAPGDGDLPLVEFLAQVPRDVLVGLEVPIRSEALAGVGPCERLGRIVAAARRLLDAPPLKRGGLG